MEMMLLNDIGIIFGLSIFILLIFNRLRIPSILGFLVTGMLAGPHGLGIISRVSEVDALAEIGIILLLFTIGVELSIKDLWDIKRSVLLGGALQVAATTLMVYYGCIYIGFSSSTSLFMGFLLSLSSTAIVLRLLQEKGEIYTPHGKTSLAILIFQDIIIVPMILVTPILAGTSTDTFNTFLLLLAKGLGIIVLMVASAKWILPALLYQVVKTRNRELFLLTIVFICLATAWLTSSAGLSLSLGAFIAGLVISESEYSHQAIGNMIPFRDIFMSLFFVSIGMLLDIRFFSDNLLVLIVITVAIIFAKSITVGLVTFIMGYPLRTTILTGMALAQVGEFSFVLSKVGLDLALLDNRLYQTFLSVTIMTMALTPFVTIISNDFADQVTKRIRNRMLINGISTRNLVAGDEKFERLQDHLVIVGYGFNGRTLANAAKNAGIPYIIIETNPETVRHEKKRGEMIHYGDASHEEVLNSANVSSARILIVGISDYVATRKIIGLARNMNPQIYIIARTRYLKEMKALYDIGANEVIPEEYETSVEIFVRLLKKYLVSEEHIEKFTREVRANGYSMLRNSSNVRTENQFSIEKELPGFEVVSLKLDNNCQLSGKKLAELNLRNNYDITVLAIKRRTDIISNPKGQTQLLPNDICVMLVKPEMIHKVKELFSDEHD
ncbi:monovalent cation:proton antiporter family protein [Methanolobus sp. ZRKC3]|uniref:cation:proton antiporter domain-containing protein n=1 Tax=Methanolobus sp. ZRKC3 TaxID=3125786 RepID=UPI00324D9557